MNIPRFTGEAALYKTSQMYRGPRSQPSGYAGSTVVPQQLSCTEKCGAELALCVAGCGFLDFFCDAGCLIAGVICQSDCGGGGGGVGGGGTHGPCGCPVGTKCCGGCTKIPGQGLVCNGDCVAKNEPCPV
jgi:hypothetical protein